MTERVARDARQASTSAGLLSLLNNVE
jgi:hypothetical protein